jgi:hypothetical protein
MARIQKLSSPALPFATATYRAVYLDQLAKILRLYFTQVDASVNQLIAPPVYIVSKLPSAVDMGIGSKTFVTDATAPTFGATVVGGGAVATPVYSDGTNWKVG